jgi:hypothetical protein
MAGAGASGDEAPPPVPPAETDITTVILAHMLAAGSDRANCVASEPETWAAFSILSGVSSESLAGEQVLVLVAIIWGTTAEALRQSQREQLTAEATGPELGRSITPAHLRMW